MLPDFDCKKTLYRIFKTPIRLNSNIPLKLISIIRDPCCGSIYCRWYLSNRSIGFPLPCTFVGSKCIMMCINTSIIYVGQRHAAMRSFDVFVDVSLNNMLNKNVHVMQSYRNKLNKTSNWNFAERPYLRRIDVETLLSIWPKSTVMVPGCLNCEWSALVISLHTVIFIYIYDRIQKYALRSTISDFIIYRDHKSILHPCKKSNGIIFFRYKLFIFYFL